MDYYSILDKNPSQAPPEPVLPDLVLPGPAPQSLVSQDLVAQNLVAQNPVAQNPVPQSLAPSDNATPNLASAARLVPTLSEVKVEAPPVVRESLRFPGEDGGKSLGEMARRDLDATLQLLAERAQYITGASGAAIALRDGESMVCCASSGPSAPELGAHLQIDSGLSAESVRTRQILRCDDAENDPRVNRESCKTFGIASVVVMPLVRGEEVYGVFELLSGRPRAFEDRDFVALNRLAEMIQTAVEHSEGARRAEKEFGQPEAAPPVLEAWPTELVADPASEIVAASSESRLPVANPAPDAVPAQAESSALIETQELAPEDDEQRAEADPDTPITTIAFGNLRRCETCGFPVSEGRRLCLDCEAASPEAAASLDSSAEFLAEFNDANPSWARSHAYLIATALIAAATIALLLWRL